MFDELPESRRKKQKGKGIALTVAIVFHLIAGVAFGISNLLAYEPIERPTITVTFVSSAAPPPPPPPPPAAKPKPKVEEVKPRPTDIKPPTGPVQPELIPDKIETPKEEPAAASSDEGSGSDGGVEGGVEGGVAGGVPGGTGTGTNGTGDEPLRVGGDVEAPVIVSQVSPRYPEAAKAAPHPGHRHPRSHHQHRGPDRRRQGPPRQPAARAGRHRGHQQVEVQARQAQRQAGPRVLHAHGQFHLEIVSSGRSGAAAPDRPGEGNGGSNG